jgi:hypothetical protein
MSSLILFENLNLLIGPCGQLAFHLPDLLLVRVNPFWEIVQVFQIERLLLWAELLSFFQQIVFDLQFLFDITLRNY